MQVQKSDTNIRQPAPQIIKPPMSWKMKFLLLIVFSIIGIFLFGATMVAKTGLVQVPVISKIVTTVGTPSRTVAIPPGTDTTQRTFQTQFEGAVARYSRSRTEDERSFEIRVSEASLTKSLLAELPGLQEKFPGATVEYAQLAVDADALELFVKMKRDGHDNTLRARFTMTIVAGKPVLSMREVSIGTFGLPTSLVNLFVKATLTKGIDEMVTAVSSVATFTSIELRRGVMIISGTLATGALNGR